MSNTNLSGTSHNRWVRSTHGILTFSFLLLAFSGYMILMVHPRLYWGETGNDLTPALIELPISRNYHHSGWEKEVPFFTTDGSPVSAGRTYDIFNQNGWARSLHFLSAWFLVITGLVYMFSGIFNGHLRRNLLPKSKEFSLKLFLADLKDHVFLRIPPASGGPAYGLLQKITYAGVVFFALPLMIISGFAMSPAITGAYPFLLKLFGGYQSARTLHFFAFLSLILFAAVHLFMVVRSGFKKQVRAMTTGTK